jgi:hypothetical protein
MNPMATGNAPFWIPAITGMVQFIHPRLIKPCEKSEFINAIGKYSTGIVWSKKDAANQTKDNLLAAAAEYLKSIGMPHVPLSSIAMNIADGDSDEYKAKGLEGTWSKNLSTSKGKDKPVSNPPKVFQLPSIDGQDIILDPSRECINHGDFGYCRVKVGVSFIAVTDKDALAAKRARGQYLHEGNKEVVMAIGLTECIRSHAGDGSKFLGGDRGVAEVKSMFRGYVAPAPAAPTDDNSDELLSSK